MEIKYDHSRLHFGMKPKKKKNYYNKNTKKTTVLPFAKVFLSLTRFQRYYLLTAKK